MNNLNPRDLSDFRSMIDFLLEHPPCNDRELYVDEECAAAIRAAFPNAGDSIISVAEVTRRKMMIFGCEIIYSGQLLDVIRDRNGNTLQVGYTDGVVVRLPDGSTFDVKGAHDLAELHANLSLSQRKVVEDATEVVGPGGNDRT